jgi:hypothetical protein
MWPVTAPIAAPAPDGQAPQQPDRGKDRAHGAHRQSPAEPVCRAVARRLLVLLDDVHLAVLVTGDDGRIEVMRRPDLVVQGLTAS